MFSCHTWSIHLKLIAAMYNFAVKWCSVLLIDVRLTFLFVCLVAAKPLTRCRTKVWVLTLYVSLMFIDNVHWIKALFQSKEECLEWLQNRLRLCVYCRCHAPEIFPLWLGNRISYLCTLMKLALRASQS